MNITKKIIAFLLFSFLLYFAIIYFKSIKQPFNAKIEKITIVSFSNNDKEYLQNRFNNVKEASKASSDSFQYIGNINNLSANDYQNYVNVAFHCRIYNNTFNNATIMSTIINSVPDDKYFLFADSLDPVSLDSRQDKLHTCSVLMYTKDLTEEEIIKLVRSVDVDVLYKCKGKANKIEVEGILDLESDNFIFQK